MTLHPFLTIERPTMLDFASSTRVAAFQMVRSRLGDVRGKLMWHHYRHALIYNWGTPELRARLSSPDFIPREEEDSDDAFDVWYTTPPPSSLRV
jgi:hypothetical protein